MQVGQGKFAMQTMNQALLNLYMKRQITWDDAQSKSSDPDELRQMLQNAGGPLQDGRRPRPTA
jgi:twitching motility protein PilT